MSRNSMEEQCPLCFKSFPTAFLERHVNSCLDTHEPVRLKSPEEKPRTRNAFAALGLKADSSRSDRSKKDATLTTLLIAERKLKRRQKELEHRLLGRRQDPPTMPLELLNSSPVQARSNNATDVYLAPPPDEPLVETNTSPGHAPPGQSITSPENQATQASHIPHSQDTLVQDSHIHTQMAHALAQTQPTTQPITQVTTQPTSQITTQPTSQPTTQPMQIPPHYDRRKEISDDYVRLKREALLPLAQRLRPNSLDDFFGQEKLVGPNGLLRNMINADQIPSFILWGVPGVGKTSLARIVASSSNHRYVELSGSDSNAKKMKEAFAAAQNELQLLGTKTILFLDEIHRFNRAVQDLLLPVLEKGIVTVIGATTENPSFTLNNALLSRMHTFVMEPLSHDALVKILSKGLYVINRTRKRLHGLHLIAMNKDAVDHIADLSAGDSRVALNILESVNAYLSGRKYNVFSSTEPDETIEVPEKFGIIKVNLENLRPLLSTRNFHQMYDKTGENHYDIISAFHKSVRGSNADAAIFYLVKMLSGGEDPLFIARRMIVIASEDIGLRESSCLPFAIATMEALQFVGMPEGEIILAHCAVKLARAPKSTKSYRALRTAQALLKEKPETMKIPVPLHLRNAPTKLMKELGYGDTYKYNPNFRHGIIEQDFMPPELKGLKFVEDTHLGLTKDEEVEEAEYEKADGEEQLYKNFKKRYRLRVKLERTRLQRLSRKRNLKLIHSLYSAERMSSYDENLDRSDQPEYFDGNERDDYLDDPESQNNFECSYDEFQPDQSDYPINCVPE